MNTGTWGVLIVMVSAAASMLSFAGAEDGPDATRIASFGKQPAVAVGRDHAVHVVFGSGDEIHYSVSRDGGRTFSAAQRVGRQEKLALGASRGPQIAVTSDYVVIAAADHTGRILVYRRKLREDQWSAPSDLLAGQLTAKEGFIAIAAGKNNEIYAAWLDLRKGSGNNIFSAWSRDAGRTWSDPLLVYTAPEGKVCPCCRPSVAADVTGNVYVMFRNEWKGARDLFVAHSKDGGRRFSPAKKLGGGTWMLEQCPMDGGAIDVSDRGTVGTTWRRDDTVYYAEPGRTERRIGAGRMPSLVKVAQGDFIVWQRDGNIMALTPAGIAEQNIGRGSYPRVASGPGNAVFCVWESPEGLFARKLN